MMNKLIDQDFSCYEFYNKKHNVFSQFGEDGILDYLIQKIGVGQGSFVEFGAWDGEHLSNCANLAKNGWSGCFIEGDKARYLDLVEKYKEYKNITPVCCYVEAVGDNTLQNILNANGFLQNIDVLSIDIDGNDYYIFESLKDFNPTICVIEYNPTIPSQVAYVQPNDKEINFGCSLSALWLLAKSKNYELVAVTDLNAFFVPNKICIDFDIAIYHPHQIKNTVYETHVFHGYDGRVDISGHKGLLWHGIGFSVDDFQILPKDLQKFPEGRDNNYYYAIERLKKSRGQE